MTHIYNFNPGPAVLPRSVLEQAQHELIDYKGVGMSVMEISHRSKEYEAINKEAEARFKRLLGVGDDYRALFVQGGASTQFAMVPLNFLRQGTTADYVLTGSWSDKALKEAQMLGTARVAASTNDEHYRRIPQADEITLSDDPAYVHLTSNNTIFGTQWQQFPELGDAPLVADMSSDILSRRFDATKFALLYAGAQKNIGPSGVTVVLIRQDWLEQAQETAPTMLRYETYATNNSLYNTPPVFAVYMLNLVLGWLEAEGGLDVIEQRNQAKAAQIYTVIDESDGFYRGHATANSRSLMNVTFRLPSEALEKQFARQATDVGMVGLAGHRSVGGVRASLYNALDAEACNVLASFMGEFARTEG